MTPKHISPAYDHSFQRRHNGPGVSDMQRMLDAVGYDTLDELIDVAIPESIRVRQPLRIAAGIGEHEALHELRSIAAQNRVYRSWIGMGYADTLTPPVIQRKVLENPSWYTAYTPYQAEIAQGRLEALLNFQTVVIDLTALPIANASLLDEATAAAEAMAMSEAVKGRGRSRFFVSELCHPQTIDVVRTRARARGWQVVVATTMTFEIDDSVFGALVQYPATDGTCTTTVRSSTQAHAAGALVTVAADLLALTLITPAGRVGRRRVVGNTQRFGVPLGYGGPHAAFSRRATSSSGRSRAASSASRVTRAANRHCAWRCRRASSTSAVRRRRATSAPRRCCSP
jgi:glycine dehydrogenase